MAKEFQKRGKVDYAYFCLEVPHSSDEDTMCPSVMPLFCNRKVLSFFLSLHENICCGYSLEVPHRGTSNEYPQHINIYIYNPLIWSYVL